MNLLRVRLSSWKWWGGGLTLVLLLAAPYLLHPFTVVLLTGTLIFGLFAMSLNVLVGRVGLVSLGHAGVFGLAAYAVAIGAVRFDWGLWPSIGFAIGVTMVGAALFALAAMRTSGVYFLMATLAEGMLLWGLAFRWTSLTDAENGIAGIPRPAGFEANWEYYYFVLLAFVVIAGLMYVVVRSPFGLALVGLRESPSRMATLGYNVTLLRFLAFMVASFFAALAGVLYAMYNRFISPDTLALSQSAEVLFMAILGGTEVFFGPLVGAGLVIFARNLVSQYTDRWPTVMGLVFMMVVLFAPDGVAGALGRLSIRLRRRITMPSREAAPQTGPVEPETPPVPLSSGPSAPPRRDEGKERIR